jgi:hypothetical protein
MENIPSAKSDISIVAGAYSTLEAVREGSEKALPLLLLIFLRKAPG